MPKPPEPDINTDFAAWTAHQWAQIAPQNDSAAAAVAIRYIRIANELAASHARTIRPFNKHGIKTIDDFRTLGLLRHIGNHGISTQHIANHLALDPATMSTRLARLEKHGHITRTEHPDNRRTHLITLNPGSKDIVDDIYTALVGNHQAFFNRLTPNEHQQLAQLLGKI